jgi:hypothetical protein
MDTGEDKQLGYPRTIGAFEVNKGPVRGKREAIVLGYEPMTAVVSFYAHSSFVLLANAARRSASSQFAL